MGLIEPFKKENGSTILLVLTMGMALTLMAGTYLSTFERQAQAHSNQRLKDDFENLSTKLVMAFSTASACRSNLNGSLFGTRLQAMSPTKNIELRFPNTDIHLRAGGKFEQLRFEKLAFSNFVQVHAPDRSYLTELIIQIKDGSRYLENKIPFYFISDHSGVFVDCFATTYPQSQPVPPPVRKLTMEDITCQQWLSGNRNAFYSPVLKTCVLGP